MNTGEKQQTARIFDIYRGTTHDGPGVRTTVFFAGCPLACGWCHNPEGIGGQRVWWQEASCIGCGLCAASCANGALAAIKQGITINPQKCKRCGACVKACPAEAMQLVQQQRDIAWLVKEALRDKPWYGTTGGVTASGGECLLQAEFVAEFFRHMHENGVGTALDTSGHVPWANLAQVLPYTDIVLYDVKEMDGAAHQRYTGQDNSLTLENLRHLAQELRGNASGTRLWIRTPLVPGATADPGTIKSIATFIKTELAGCVERWELCAFNNSCITKYTRLGLAWPYRGTGLLNKQEADGLLRVAYTCGLQPENVAVTGLLGTSGNSTYQETNL